MDLSEERTPPVATKKVKSVNVKLSEPLEWGSETISELTLRRPKAKDIEHISSNPTMKEMMTVAQKCAGVPRRVIEELDIDDANNVMDAVADFLDGGHQTGKTRSF